MHLPTPENSHVHTNGRSDVPTNAAPGLGANGRAHALYRWLLHNRLRGVEVPVEIILWNGERLITAPGPPVARVRIRDRWTLPQLLVNPDLGFGDAYSDGRIEVEGDLVRFLEWMFRATPPPAPAGFLRRCLTFWRTRRRSNSRRRARDNIYHHYDVGNDFYRLWLDDQLVYTCAYFPSPDLSLEQAQVAKMDHVCRKLQLRPGQTVVEAGCGWGALARHMARHYGVTVKAFNISHAQIVYARECARAEGLDRQVEYVEDDYRQITGRFDVFVSVGMLEHVGVEHYRDLGGVIHRCLKPAGRGLIHSIGRNQPSPTNPWLEKRIFPGAYMPSLGEMMAVFEPWGFSVLDVENLRLHYARTLEHWLHRFDQAADRVREMFDERFVRTWRLYLASSLAGFTSGRIQLFQVVFAPGASNEVPWTRAHIYDGQTAC
jgi:cyclopropane-fatty-acyl-phospholipid synthase